MDIKKVFFYSYHLLAPFSLLMYADGRINEPMFFIIALSVYIYSFLISTSWRKTLFLYLSFILTKVSIVSLLYWFQIEGEVIGYSTFIVTLIIFYIWSEFNAEWKKRTFYFLLPFTTLSLFLTQFIHYTSTTLLLAIIQILLILIVNHKSKLQVLNFIPLSLALLYINIDTLSRGLFDLSYMSIFVLFTLMVFTLIIIGEKMPYLIKERGRKN